MGKELNTRVLVELVGAGAVLLGLIFVGFELRQNTNAVQASTLQGIIDLSTNYLIETSLDEDFIRLLSKAQAEPDQLDEVEALQIQRILRSQNLRYQGAFTHWRRGSLGDEDWDTYYRFICSSPVNVGTGSFGSVQRRFWQIEKSLLTDEYVAFVEECRPDLAEPTN